MELILGSQSIGRRKVLEDAGYKFNILVANIDEKAIRSDDLEELPLLIAKAKAEKLLPLIKRPSVLITSDQIVVCQGELWEKPESKRQAREYLKSYCRFPAQTNTAVVVTNTETREQVWGIDISKTFFKPMSQKTIKEIVDSGIAMTASGGYSIEHPLFQPYIDHVEGSTQVLWGYP